MKIPVSGLVNTKTTTAVRGFPIQYYPIDYTFFGVNTAVFGVEYSDSPEPGIRRVRATVPVTRARVPGSESRYHFLYNYCDEGVQTQRQKCTT